MAIYDVTETELSILECLWAGGALTIGDISDQLYGSRAPSVYATVQSLLQRLEGKELVRRTRSGRAHVYEAAVDRATLVGEQLTHLADRLCEGSFTPLLSSLVQTGKLSAADIAELRALLDAPESKPVQKKGRAS